MKILVAYASAKGSTAEVAARIGHHLRDRGFQADVAAVGEVASIGGYDALVLGSAIQTGTWLPAMTDFATRFRHELEARPTYLWMSCIRVLEQFGDEHVREHYVNHETLKHMNVRDIAVFAGKLDLSTIDWSERWTLAARYDGHAWPSGFDGDFRDWNKIEAWAGRIAEALKQMPAPPAST